MLGFLWWPYRRLIPHRSLWSHGPLLGTTLRLAWLLTWCLIATMAVPALSPSLVLAALQQLESLPAALEAEPLPTQGALEATLKDAEALLLEVGFLYPHTAAARMAKLRQLLLRAEPQEAEVALLRGMVRQLRWASRHGKPEEGR